MDGSKQHCACGVTSPQDKTGRQHANENMKAVVKQLTKHWYTKAAGLSTQSGVTRDLPALLATHSAAAVDRQTQLQVERLLIWQASLSSGSRSSAPPRQLTGTEWLNQTEENAAPDRLRRQTGEEWLNLPETHLWEDPMRLRDGWEYLDLPDEWALVEEDTPLPLPLSALDGLWWREMTLGQKMLFKQYLARELKKDMEHPGRHPCKQQ